MRTLCGRVDTAGALFLSILLFGFIVAEQWPYNHYDSIESNSGRQAPDLKKPKFNEPSDLFMTWLAGVVAKVRHKHYWSTRSHNLVRRGHLRVRWGSFHH
jgi:hypothetical protein